MSTGADRRGHRPPGHGREQAQRHHQQAAEDHRRQRRDLGFELQLLQALLQPRLEVVGALAGLARVEPGVGLAGLLLELELLGAVIPVGDLLGQPVLHRRLGLGDQLELARPAPPRGAPARRGRPRGPAPSAPARGRSRRTRAGRGSPPRPARPRPAAGSRGRARSGRGASCPSASSST